MNKLKLGDICTIIKGTKVEQTTQDCNSIRYIQIEDLRSNEYIKYCRKKENYVIADPNDIIIAWDGANAGTVGFGLNGAIGSTLAIIRLNRNDLDTRFLGLLLRSKFKYLRNNCTGATIPHINRRSLEEIRLPLLPLETQKQIAKTLDTVSEILAMRKQQLTELDNLIKSVFYDMFGDPIKNTKGWERKELSNCCYVNPKKSEINCFTDNLEVSFVSMASVSEKGDINTNEIKLYKEVKAGFTYFYENDVLFAKITPCMENGKGAIARGLKNNIGFGSTEFHVLRPKNGISNSEWLYHLTALPVFRDSAEKNMTGSAGQKRVPVSFFDKFFVPLPPISLQDEFATIVTKIEAQKSLVKKSIEETQLLFDSLMSQYFDE